MKKTYTCLYNDVLFITFSCLTLKETIACGQTNKIWFRASTCMPCRNDTVRFLKSHIMYQSIFSRYGYHITTCVINGKQKPINYHSIAETIKHSKTMKSISLISNNCDITHSRDVQAIVDAIKDSGSITSITLEGLGLRDDDVELIADLLIDTEKNKSKIVAINLGFNKIGAQGALFLADAIKKSSSITSIDLCNNVYIQSEGVRHLASVVTESPSLNSINLYGCNIDTIGVQFIAAAISKTEVLSFLDLGNNSIGSNEMQVIATAIKMNKSLTYINLNYNNLGGEGVSIMSVLIEENCLTSIDLIGNWIGDKDLEVLGNAINKSQVITSVDLRCNFITKNGVRFLVRAIEESKSLAFINLSSNSIGDEGVQIIANAISNQKNPTINTMDFSCCGIGIDGILHISSCMERNSSITSIDLSDNGLTHEAAKIIANNIIKKNSNILSISLRRNQIGCIGAKAIFDAIISNNSSSRINYLDISSNFIKNDGAYAIANALKINKTIKEINLSRNVIEYMGAFAIAEVISESTSPVTSISMMGNDIYSKEKLLAIESIIKKNPFVTSVHLEYS